MMEDRNRSVFDQIFQDIIPMPFMYKKKFKCKVIYAKKENFKNNKLHTKKQFYKIKKINFNIFTSMRSKS